MENNILNDLIERLAVLVIEGRDMIDQPVIDTTKEIIKKRCADAKNKEILAGIIGALQLMDGPSPMAAELIDKIFLVRKTVPKVVNCGIVI